MQDVSINLPTRTPTLQYGSTLMGRKHIPHSICWLAVATAVCLQPSFPVFAEGDVKYRVGATGYKVEYDRSVDNCGPTVFDRQVNATLIPSYRTDDWQVESNGTVDVRPLDRATGRIANATGSLSAKIQDAKHEGTLSLAANYNDGSAFGCIAKPSERLARAHRIAERKLIIGDAQRSQSGSLGYSYGSKTDRYNLMLTATRDELTNSLTNRTARIEHQKAESAIWSWKASLAAGLDKRVTEKVYHHTAALQSTSQISRLTSVSSSVTGITESNSTRRLEVSGSIRTLLSRFDALGINAARSLVIDSNESSSTRLSADYGHRFSEDTVLTLTGLRTAYDDAANSSGTWVTESLSHRLTPRHSIIAMHGSGNMSPQQSKGQTTSGVQYAYRLSEGAAGGIRQPLGLDLGISYNRDEVTFLNNQKTGIKKAQITATASF